jgi:Ser/Thr protein kinase RdoA (MazF antagonist)
MSARSLDLDAQVVLHQYGFVRPECVLEALGNRGGFSGARLWRLESAAGWLCLKAWPQGGTSPVHLGRVHELMRLARDRGLAFVPLVFWSDDGATCVEHAGRLWDLTSWLPGKADFHDHPTSTRLEAACTALAQLHAAWAAVSPTVRPCPAIQRRLDRAHEWQALVRSGWQPQFATTYSPSIRPLAERAWALLLAWADWVPRVLARWVEPPQPLQPCLCDIWHDHVLFEGDAVRGLIDYGSVKLDHVAVDLARLLGSMAGDDTTLRAAGLQGYARLRPLTWQEEELVTVLDETGTLLGLANWLNWLYREGRRYEEPDAVAGRLRTLVERVESWNKKVITAPKADTRTA